MGSSLSKSILGRPYMLYQSILQKYVDDIRYYALWRLGQLSRCMARVGMSWHMSRYRPHWEELWKYVAITRISYLFGLWSTDVWFLSYRCILGSELGQGVWASEFNLSQWNGSLYHYCFKLLLFYVRILLDNFIVVSRSQGFFDCVWTNRLLAFQSTNKSIGIPRYSLVSDRTWSREAMLVIGFENAENLSVIPSVCPTTLSTEDIRTDKQREKGLTIYSHNEAQREDERRLAIISSTL